MKDELTKNNDCIMLSDFNLCCTLVFLGFPVLTTYKDKYDPERISFVFHKTNELTESMQKFWNGLLAVEPKRYWSITREMKARVKSSN